MSIFGHRPRRGHATIVLVILLGVSALALTQCRLVDDTVTGVDLKSGTALNGRSACVHTCNDQFKDCKRTEDALHRLRRAECKKAGSRAERRECKKAEEGRHQDAHLACVKAKNDCKKGCYNEGSGGGGH